MLILTLLARKETTLMTPSATTPAEPEPAKNPITWGSFIATARRKVAATDHPLAHGLDPRLLLCYATGSCAADDRGFVHTVLLRAPGAMRAVLGLVRAAREPKSRAAQLIETARTGGLACFSATTDEQLYQMIEEASAPPVV